MPDVLLRAAELDDAAILLDVILQAFEAYRGKFDPPSGVFVETVDTIRGKVASGGGYLATLDNTVAGCVLYQYEADHKNVRRVGKPSFRLFFVKQMIIPEGRLFLSADIQPRTAKLVFSLRRCKQGIVLKANAALKGSAGVVRTREASERPCSLVAAAQWSRLVSACDAALSTCSLLEVGSH